MTLYFQVMCYGCGNYICYACRNMPSQFQESKYITFSMVNTIQTFVIAVPMIVMMSDNPQIAFLFKILFLNMQTLGNLTLSIGPPVYKILKGDTKASKVTSSGATTGTVVLTN
jgi:hypothetical protein